MADSESICVCPTVRTLFFFNFENTPKKINKIKGIRGLKWGFLTLIKEVFENGETFFFVKYGRYFLHIMSNFFNEKKARSKIPLNPKALFKWVFMDIVPSTAPKSLSIDTNVSNYLLTVGAYSKIPKLMIWRKSQQKKLWTNWICFNPDLGKLTNFDGGI